MSPDEVRAFLLHGTRTGNLGVSMSDGQPHVMPIWFVLDEEFGARNAAAGELLVRLTPERVVAQSGVAD
jgi:nitroimidazol reductase NimA-like FMN-containing flavoprotein (pyridoxamine 5'-phosphate oxidase superfamily)